MLLNRIRYKPNYIIACANQTGNSTVSRSGSRCGTCPSPDTAVADSVQHRRIIYHDVIVAWCVHMGLEPVTADVGVPATSRRRPMSGQCFGIRAHMLN